MPRDMDVRPIAPADDVRWRALWRDYLAFYETTLPEAIYRTTFARLTDPAQTGQFGFLAWRGDRAVGLVHIICHRHNWRLEDTCYLQDLYVMPDARGSGVGRALIEAVYHRADADGCPSVYWMTQDHNAPARRLYDHVGRLTSFIKYVRP